MPKKSTKTKKVEENKKEPVKTTTKKEEFSFGSKMTKEERQAIIEEALKPKTKPAPKWTVEESEYNPDKFVVVMTPSGNIYQEAVPKSYDFNTFVYILASIPDKPLDTANRINFESEIYKTSFEVKGVDAYIITVPYRGNRKPNSYDKPFGIKNLTSTIGGNIVFAKDGGFTKKEASKVVEQMIKLLENYEEIDKF